MRPWDDVARRQHAEHGDRDPSTSPVDRDRRFHAIDNLYVTDARALPTSGAVNPSLTIAANALRIGAGLAARAVRRQPELLAERERHAHGPGVTSSRTRAILSSADV